MRGSLTNVLGRKSHATDNFTTDSPRSKQTAAPQLDENALEAAEIDALGRELDDEFGLFGGGPGRRAASRDASDFYYHGEQMGAVPPSGRRPEGIARTAPKRVSGGRLGGPGEQFTPADHRSQTVGRGAPYTARQASAVKSKHWQKVQQNIANARVHGRGAGQTSRLPSVGTPRSAKPSPLKASREVTQPSQPSVPSGGRGSHGGDAEGIGFTKERAEVAGARKLLEEVPSPLYRPNPNPASPLTPCSHVAGEDSAT